MPDKDLSQDELDEQTLYENWDQPYPHPFQKALAALINLADDYAGQTVQAAHQALTTVSDSFATSQMVTPDDPDPLITPPLYGRWHALTSRLLTNPDGTPIDPDDNWVHELNLDPRFRVPAGTGGRIVRAHDEEYMQAAWDQLGQVLEANRRIRAAQVARELTFVYHQRQLEPCGWPPGASCSSVTGPLQSRVVPDAERRRARLRPARPPRSAAAAAAAPRRAHRGHRARRQPHRPDAAVPGHAPRDPAGLPADAQAALRARPGRGGDGGEVGRDGETSSRPGGTSCWTG